MLIVWVKVDTKLLVGRVECDITEIGCFRIPSRNDLGAYLSNVAEFLANAFGDDILFG